MTPPPKKRKNIAFFGNFDSTNFGNECSLQAALYNLRRFHPDANVTCICTGPEAASATHGVAAIPISNIFIQSWVPRNRLAKLLRQACVALLNEPYQWLKDFWTLRRMDLLIVPGTGLMTDTYGLFGWGPYSLFKWTGAARLARCKVAFMSIGAGPLITPMGRWFAKAQLALARHRSYRDAASADYLKSIGVPTERDGVYPDLAFSLPEPDARRKPDAGNRPVVGLGVMTDAGMRGLAGAEEAIYAGYLEALAVFVTWLIERGHDIRLIVGDLGDTDARDRLTALLKDRLPPGTEGRLFREPINSVADLLNEIGASDIVVATRFHNLVLAFVCNKPVIAISFHPKCTALMGGMGASDYCMDIEKLDGQRLTERFCDIEAKSDTIKSLIRERAAAFRAALEQQYRQVFENI